MQYSLTKLAIAAIVFFAVVGGAVWYLLQPSEPVTPQTNTGDFSSAIPGDQPQGATNVQTQKPKPVLPDIAGEYKKLFTKLSAEQVQWTRVSTTAGVFGDVYALYAKDIETYKKTNPSQTDFSIGITEVDLNGDGAAEALVFEDLQSFCGTGGCPLEVHQKKDGKWAQMLSVVVGGEVGLSTTSTGGFRDLLLTTQGVVGSQSIVVRYVWNGSAYAAQKSVAAWDGTTFRLAR